MNLNGKYIKVDNNNIRYIIKFLYNNGYQWNDYEYKFNQIIDKINISMSSGWPYKWIHIYEKSIFCLNRFDPSNPTDDEIFDIMPYIREQKLKRILK